MKVYIVTDRADYYIEKVYEIEEDAKNHCKRTRDNYSEWEITPPIEEANRWHEMTDEEIVEITNAIKLNKTLQWLDDNNEWKDNELNDKISDVLYTMKHGTLYRIKPIDNDKKL